jgi:hypothetical protein
MIVLNYRIRIGCTTNPEFLISGTISIAWVSIARRFDPDGFFLPILIPDSPLMKKLDSN